MAHKAYRTTMGSVTWDEYANYVLSVDDPIPPNEPGDWRLVGSDMEPIRNSHQTIVWFWEGTISNVPEPPRLTEVVLRLSSET